MVTVAETGIDFFAEELPGLEDLQKLSLIINAGERSRIEFATALQEKNPDGLRKGIGNFILGNYKEAVDFLTNAVDSKEKYLFLGRACRRMNRYDDAIGALDAALSKGADTMLITLEKCESLCQAGRIEEAWKQLETCANFENVSADYHYYKGRLLEAQGDYEDGMEQYKQALELDPDHQNALFHLGYACDLRGLDELAIEYYRRIVQGSKVYTAALLNLAVIYEDRSMYEQSLNCVKAVLKSHPNHKKAQLFAKDIESSMVMVYDEEKERRRDRRNQILEIPISDFELSVRSRNCLRKMNIRTLGDLLRITEAELLSYKNFGETSLNEIKKILDTKGLQLGMALEDAKLPGATPEAAQVEGADEEVLSKPVEDLELSVRSRRCLSRLGIRGIGELISKTEAELLGCKNFGVTSLNEIKDRLTNFGLSLRKLE